MSDFARLIAPFGRRLGNMIARGTVAASNAATKMQTLQMRLLAKEVKDDVEHFEPYGFTSAPASGAEGIALFLDGDRSHGIVVVVADRRYRLTGLATGEVALHDDLGQKVHLTRAGIVVHSAALVRVEAANVQVHASQSYSWDVAGFGERWTWSGGTTWEHKTWQTGATVVPVSQPIHPPEGP